MDFDEIEKVRESLFESEAQKNAIVEGFTGILIFFNKHMEAKWVNNSTYEKFPDVIGRRCYEIFCQQSSACDNCASEKASKSGVIESSTRRVEGVSEDGEEAVFDMVASPVKDQVGEVLGMIVIAYNVTEKYTLERQLRHTQKMEAIGTLAGGVAHDFNNVLTPIMGYSEIIRLKLQNDKYEEKQVYDYLEEILKAAKRAKSLVEQVLTFSRTMEKKAVLQYMHPVVKEVMKLMRVTLPSTIVIKEKVDESCGRVLIDPVQMHQVLINLCTNASHSMGGKHGNLIVRLALAKRDKDDREWVELSVEDSGRGIEKEHLERIFEPYFSTKEKTSGTGMGLAMVHGIVNSQGGDIEVESEVGKGTIFRIYLPIADASTPLEQVAEVGDIRGGAGRILLVDDEAQVVKVTGEILKKLGYEVVGRTSSAEVLEIFSRDPEDFDLLMTDLTMPGLTGLELSERVKDIRADIPIILFTGYSDQVSKSAAKDAGIDEYCMKPISMRVLSNVVGKFLGEINSGPFDR